jgi:hypothetical protein
MKRLTTAPAATPGTPAAAMMAVVFQLASWMA